MLEPGEATEPREEPAVSAADSLDPEWERQKRRLLRRRLILTVIGAAMFVLGLAFSFVESMRR